MRDFGTKNMVNLQSRYKIDDLDYRIAEVKKKLSIREVLDYYGLKTYNPGQLHCPFHTFEKEVYPSMYIFDQSNTVFCFSSCCELLYRSIDQIDFIMYKEGINKYAATEKAQQLIEKEFSRVSYLI